MLPSLAMACPSSAPFSGFNASICVGLEMPSISTKGELKNFIPATEDLTFNISRTVTDDNINGGARLGYNLIFKDFFLIGLAGDAFFGDNRLQASSRVVEIGSELLIATNTNIKLSKQFALLIKLGKLFGNRTLLYGLVGPRWGKFSLSFDARFQQDLGVFLDTQLQTRNRYYKEGVLLGIGSELLLTRCISLGFEYLYTYYGHPKLPSAEAPITQDGVIIPDAKYSFTSNIKARSNDVILRLGYYF